MNGAKFPCLKISLYERFVLASQMDHVGEIQQLLELYLSKRPAGFLAQMICGIKYMNCHCCETDSVIMTHYGNFTNLLRPMFTNLDKIRKKIVPKLTHGME